QAVQFIINVQHDCGAAGCAETGTCQRRVEQELSMVTEKVVEHADEAKYIINMHALHNASKLRWYLPWCLTEPTPLVAPEARPDHHRSIASSVHEAGLEKRRK
ncbi:hypothetical protein DFP72DRAFT_758356, partial [Ephemerocybe angulata]